MRRWLISPIIKDFLIENQRELLSQEEWLLWKKKDNKMWIKWNPCTLLREMQISTSVMESSMDTSQKF